jgi:hypothetical protein
MASSRTAATSNPILTNYAQGLSQDRTSALAEFIAPTVVVPATIGHFKKYDDKNLYQVLTTARAVGGAARRIEFDASDPTYNCKPQALEITIDDAERAAAGDADPIGLEQAKTSVLVNTAVLSHENAVLTAIKAGLTAETGKGAWSNPDIDPIDQIDEQIKAICDATGMLPNRIALGIGAYAILRRNPKVKARLTGVKTGSFTLPDLTSCLLNPSIEVRLGTLVKDAYKFPKTGSNSNVVGDECFIFYNNGAPSTYDPGFAKTFRGGTGSVDAVRVYRDESHRSDVLAVDWSVDIQVVATSMAKRISVS